MCMCGDVSALQGCSADFSWSDLTHMTFLQGGHAGTLPRRYSDPPTRIVRVWTSLVLSTGRDERVARLVWVKGICLLTRARRSPPHHHHSGVLEFARNSVSCIRATWTLLRVRNSASSACLFRIPLAFHWRMFSEVPVGRGALWWWGGVGGRGGRKGGEINSSPKSEECRSEQGWRWEFRARGKGLRSNKEKDLDEVTRVRGVRTRMEVREGELGAKPGGKQVGSGQTKKQC